MGAGVRQRHRAEAKGAAYRAFRPRRVKPLESHRQEANDWHTRDAAPGAEPDEAERCGRLLGYFGGQD